ncbi:MAG: restriction endonuclease subunit S [Desulfobacterales bacterium]
MKNYKPDWWKKPFPECITPIRFERSKQIKTNSYLPIGNFPIIDQGQTKIAGWTNDKSAVINDNLPLIIFGDHTRVFKYIDFPFAIGADGTKIIKPNCDEFCSRYIYYYLQNLNLPSRGYSRHYKLLKESEISYPEISEQEKIAAVLLKIQQAIEVQESIIEAAQELKKSTMQHVFTYGLRGERTKETEIGRVPESWEIKKFGEFATLHRGYDLPIQDRKKGKVPIVGSNGICGYHNQSKIKGPGVVTGRSGSIGMSYYINDDYWPLNTGLYVENFHNNVPLYNHYFFQFFNFKKYSSGVSVPTLNRNLVHAAFIAVPLIKEQNDIASVFKTIDDKIEVHSTKKSALQDIFKTMLNKLMTGEIKFKDLDIDTSCVLEMKNKG